MWKIGILLLYFVYIVLAAEGDCVKEKKEHTNIPIGEGVYERITTWKQEKICCDGYQNVTGECEPICKEACVEGKCVAPNKCECNDGWHGDTCGLAPTPSEDRFSGAECRMNCSAPCPVRKYGVHCNETCLCQNDSECDNRNGRCTCKPGFQGNFCEKNCSLGTWGANCTHSCNCDGSSCDARTGSCHCKPGYTGAQCTDFCEHDSCGENCSQTCNCGNGKCSKTDCTCSCNEGWIGNNCNEMKRTCGFMRYGINCSETCYCNASNTETCDVLSGNCVCKAGWIGQTCETPCEGGSYGVNCTSICWHVGLANYTCHHTLGEICNTNYAGEDCEICKCEPNGWCNSKGDCECNPGNFGNYCLKSCPANKYGKNCELNCECENCRKSDGHCKCQEGFQGVDCSDYCPISFYNRTTGKCFINLPDEVRAPIDNLMYYIIVVAVGVLIPVVSIIIIYTTCKKTQADSTIDISVSNSTVAPENIPVSNEFETEHDCDVIPERPPSYQGLIRPDEIDHRFHDQTYFDGYETLRVSQNVEMYNMSPA